MKEAEKPNIWLEYCRHCGGRHKWKLGVCPSCNVYEVPVPVSDNICWVDYDCDGCVAYRDHLR